MRKNLSALLIAVLLVAGISATAVAVNSSGDPASTEQGRSGKAKQDKGHQGQQHGKADHEKGKPDKAGRGHGNDEAWKKYWHDLTPAQRADKMAELAQDHADGMKKFASCVKAAGEDEAARAKCEKPLPPGLAKKLLH